MRKILQAVQLVTNVGRQRGACIWLLSCDATPRDATKAKDELVVQQYIRLCGLVNIRLLKVVTLISCQSAGRSYLFQRQATMPCFPKSLGDSLQPFEEQFSLDH
jgi:hypothetical protein